MKYSQKTIVFSIVLLWNCLAGAQVTIGVVCDKATKLPVSNVYVNLNGFIHAITDVSGKFELRTNSVTNTKMTLHHVAYQTAIIDSPFNGFPDTLYIEEHVNKIPEIAVIASKKVKNKRIKRFAVVEFVIENDDSISDVKLIRSSGYPSIDAYALQYPNFALKRNPKYSRGKPIREKHTFYFDRSSPPPIEGHIIDMKLYQQSYGAF